MSRLDLIRTVLAKELPNDNYDRFLEYRLNSDKVEFLKDTALSVLERIPAKPYDCALLSATWAAIIEELSDIPVKVFCGHLQYHDFYIFRCNAPLPSANLKEINEPIVIREEWDGHCWLEFGGLIADLSLFRTLRYGNVKSDVKEALVSEFGENTGLLALPAEKMIATGLIYTPMHVLSTTQIDGIINGLLNPPND